MTRRVLRASFAVLLLLFAARAEDKKEDPSPSVNAWAPLEISPGQTATVLLRGLKLDEATEVRFPAAGDHIKATLGEKKKADAIKGFEPKEAGDTQLEVKIELASDYSADRVAFVVVTEKGTSESRELLVRPAEKLRAEPEPNGGFHEAPKIEPGTIVTGRISEDRDVDVFRVSVVAGMTLSAEVMASRTGSLLDPVLTIYDANGLLLATDDDSAGERDARAQVTRKSDGDLLISVSDANDHSSSWHSYELTTSVAAGAREENADGKVSFFREVAPILKHNCNGCHRPGKTKGQLDLTTFGALMKGGKHGETVLVGAPDESRIIEEISGDEPSMPDDGDPLSAAEVALITRWIAEGAADDTPADAGLHKLAQPPIYTSLPAVSALAWSPDGNLLAVAGYHEILLHRADGGEIVERLRGYSPRIESIAFSSDGQLMAVAGGAPSEYGEIQIWDLKAGQLQRSIITTTDVVYGVSFSPNADKVAVGCADKTVRAFQVATGEEMMKCDNHIDWVFGTAFSLDGVRLASASRDRAVKLIDVATGHLIDDINRPGEPVCCLARNSKADEIVFGDEKGGLRVHKMEPRGGRLAEGDDKENSAIRELDRMPDAVHALAWSIDGSRIAAACESGEARVFQASDGKRLATIQTGAALYSVAISPDAARIATAGFDGKVRIFGTEKGEPLGEFDSVPVAPAVAAQSPR